MTQPIFDFHKDTPDGVKKALESAYKNNTRIRIHLGDVETGRVWLEEWDVVGYVGRSTGIQKAPLLLRQKNSSGGGAILTHCILRIQETNYKKDLYKAPNYTAPSLDVKHNLGGTDIPFEVFREGELQARFRTEKRAKSYVAFMRGEDMTQ